MSGEGWAVHCPWKPLAASQLPPKKAMLEYGDPGAVSAKSDIFDRHSSAGQVDGQGRTIVVPLSRRIRRRISSTLNAESIPLP